MHDREIQIQEIRKWLNMSPNQFISFLNDPDSPKLSTSLDEAYYEYRQNLYPYGQFFTRDMLDNPNFTVHILDWKEFKKSNPDLVGSDTENHEHIDPELPLWGLPKRVYAMKQEGKSDKEIATKFKEWGLSYQTITALLYPGDNLLSDWTQPAKIYLGIKGKDKN